MHVRAMPWLVVMTVGFVPLHVQQLYLLEMILQPIGIITCTEVSFE